ncbi:hypothetical protein PALB_6330 [Pseudoalteromonas luteoviolacea B = ATCC 29581]|nr:hypothetical protein PALB_6330 [Pseudoalteromonas luteoviolacea B = ATCC 29581]
MDVTQTLVKAASIMMTGMVGVFVFLIVLIFLVKLIARFAKNDVQPEQARSNEHQTIAPMTSNGVSTSHIAAISAAIAQYRKQQQG